MRNELITFRNSVLAGMLCLVAASCSDEAGTDNRLPEGKYPITFSAAVDGLAVSRATSEGSWIGDGTEKVAIQIGQDVKKYTAASGGSLTVDKNENGPFYWTSKEMQVSAWYSSTYANTRPTTFSIKENQNGDGYQASDFLYAMEKITFETGSSSANLKFYHLPAKVIVNLKNGDGVTENEVSGATVSFVNQATVSGEITWNEDGGTVSVEPVKSADNPVDITPKEIDPASSYQKSVQALLVPQEMENKQFIKVSIVEGGVTRNYFYTPEKGDADLEAGKLYTYEITVKKEGLSVTVVQSVLWNEEKQVIGDLEKATLRVYLPENHGQTLTIKEASQVDKSNVYKIDNHGNSFSISYTITDENKAKDFLIAKGLGDCNRSVNDNICTLTYSNVRSDLWLSYTLYSEVGYYYYSDGTCSPGPDKEGSATCIGIVFKVGAGEGDGVANYPEGKFVDNMIHGYVVALNDTETNRQGWGGGINDITLSTDRTLFLGYANTDRIKKMPGYNETTAWACYQAVNYKPVAPDNSAYLTKSSGWYLPSLGEYNALWQVYGIIDSKFPLDANKMKKEDGMYWTSSKAFNGGALVAAPVYFGYWNSNNSLSIEFPRDGNSFVRPVLTF